MRIKSVGDCEFKVDKSAREITGYASHFGSRDHAGEIVWPGAYAKTLKERLPKKLIKYCIGHGQAVGMPKHAEEDSQGLLTVTKVSATRDGDEHLTLVDDGVFAHMSVGYDVLKSDLTKDADGEVTRNLREMRLYEYSCVQWPANENCSVLAVKGLIGGESKGLYDLADGIGCLARLRWLIEYGPKLSDEEQQIAMQLIADMTEVTTEVKALLEPAKATPMPEPPPTDLKAFESVLAALAVRGSIHKAARAA